MTPALCQELDFIDELDSAWTGHREFATWITQYVQSEHTVAPVIVDLGVDNGYSTFVWGGALQGSQGVVYGIDLFTGSALTGFHDKFDAVQIVMDVMDVTNVEMLRGDFNSFAKIWTKPIDILHIDGGHSFAEVMNDFEHWQHFVKEDGLILFHDIAVEYPGFGVKAFFFEELKKRNVAYLAFFSHSYGLGVYTKNAKMVKAIQEEFNNKRNRNDGDSDFFHIAHVI
jgi:hypothetical protein